MTVNYLNPLPLLRIISYLMKMLISPWKKCWKVEVEAFVRRTKGIDIFLPATSNFVSEMLARDLHQLGHEFWKKAHAMCTCFKMFALRSSSPNNSWQIKQTVFLQLRSLPRYVGKIWKHSFISTVRPTVHTNPSRKRSISKTLRKLRNLKMIFFRFSGERNILDTRWHDANLEIPQPEFFLKHKSKMTGVFCVFKFWINISIWATARLPLP